MKQQISEEHPRGVGLKINVAGPSGPDQVRAISLGTLDERGWLKCLYYQAVSAFEKHVDEVENVTFEPFVLKRLQTMVGYADPKDIVEDEEAA